MTFSNRTFELLTQLHASGRYSFYKQHEPDFRAHLVEPFRALILKHVTPRLPRDVAEAMQTTRRIFGQVHKNDFGQGGAYPYYWAALYPRDAESKQTDVQLLVFIERNYLEFGFFLGWYTPEERAGQLRDNCQGLCRSQEDFSQLTDYLEQKLPGARVVNRSQEYGEAYYDTSQYNSLMKKNDPFSWPLFLQALSTATHEDIALHSPMVVLPKDTVLRTSTNDLGTMIVNCFTTLFTLVLLATTAQPLPAIRAYIHKHK